MLTSEGAHTMEQDDHDTKVASSATSAEVTAEVTDVDVEEADMTRWTEAEFEEKCTYIVKDTPWDVGQTHSTTATRAESSLPRNLAFKSSSGSKEVRLKHARTHDSEVGGFHTGGSRLIINLHTHAHIHAVV